MLNPSPPTNENDRLAELDKLDLMYSQPEEVFDRLTAQLAEAFDAPAVMMNLIDETNQFVKSSSGIPDEVLGDRIMPRSTSLCNYVITTNQPLLVEDLSTDERFKDNPLVKAHGLRFYAGAPLHSDNGQPMGTLCVLDYKPRTLTVRERKLLKMLANTLMTEVNLRKTSRSLLERTREMERDLLSARSVQRFLLPPQSQTGDGFSLRHFYHPFDAIGGDFIDARLRPDGSMATILADVSGHGASAALTSAMVKTVFQRAAGEAAGPGEILTAVQRDLSNATEGYQFITAAAAIYHPSGRRVQLASAGHPYPILMRGSEARLVDTANELPLLIDAGQIYPDKTELQLEPNDRLVFYTDGASEAADASGAMLETAGLMGMIQAKAGLQEEEFLGSLFAGIRAFANGRLRDDVALICLDVK